MYLGPFRELKSTSLSRAVFLLALTLIEAHALAQTCEQKAQAQAYDALKLYEQNQGVNPDTHFSQVYARVLNDCKSALSDSFSSISTRTPASVAACARLNKVFIPGGRGSTDACGPCLDGFVTDGDRCVALSEAELSATVPTPRRARSRAEPNGSDDGSDGDSTPDSDETSLASNDSEAASAPDANSADSQPSGQTTIPHAASFEYTAQQARTEIAAFRDACGQAFQEANLCCNDPTQCLFGRRFGSQGEVHALLNTMIGVGGQMLSQEAGAGDGGQINRACEIMKTAGYSVAGLNAAGATQCKAYQSTCSTVCQERSQIIENRAALCGFDLSSGQPGSSQQSCDPLALEELRVGYFALRSRSDSCLQFNANIVEAGAAGAQSLRAAQLSELCQKASSTNTTVAGTGLEKPSRIIGSSDCLNPANFSDPACSCSNPAFQSTLRCRDQLSGLSPRSKTPADQNRANSLSSSAALATTGTKSANTGELPAAAGQIPLIAKIEA